jgi:outer membrane protein
MILAAFVFAAVATTTAPADTSVHALTLGEVVALAERNAPAVIHALGQTRATSASVLAAYGAFLPNLSINATLNQQVPEQAGRTQVVNGQVQIFAAQPLSYNQGLNATLSLFTGGSQFFSLQQAHALANAASVDVVEQRAVAALAAKQQFFNVIASLEAEAAASAQLDLARQQLAMSVIHLHAQTVTRSDSLRSQILVHNGELALSTAHTGLLEAQASLTRLVGTEYTVTAAPSDSLDPAVLSLDDGGLRALALDGPAVHLAEAQLAAAQAALRIGWATYMPTVTASYSRTGSGTSDDVGDATQHLGYSGAVRVAVSLPIFDQFQRSSQVTAAEVARDDAVATLRDSRLAALESLTQSLGAYHSADERVDLQTATLQAAEEDLREHQEQYKVGTSTMVDVLTSEATLVQAQHDLIQARYDRRIAKAQLEALTGRSL